MNSVRETFLRELHDTGMSPCIGVFSRSGGGYIIFGTECRLSATGVILGTETERETNFEEIERIEIPERIGTALNGLSNDLKKIQDAFPDTPFQLTHRTISGVDQEALVL